MQHHLRNPPWVDRLMNIEPGSQALAQEGLRQIETAVLQLLDANPQGLRNAQIAESLGLRSDFRGRQKDI